MQNLKVGICFSLKKAQYCLVFAILILGLSGSLAAEPPAIEHIWTLEGFEDPESAAIDVKNRAIYLSNVNGYELDNNGYISKVSLDGKDVNRKWLEQVHSPTGVSIHEGKLYFADVNALVVADIKTATILKRIHAPDANANPVLNDVAINESGDVYVSGSRSRTIYKLVDDELVVWVKDEVRLALANGLLAANDQIIHGGKLWTVFNEATRDIVETSVKPDGKLEDFDGITADPRGGYLVTVINDSRLWRVTAQGTKPVLEDSLEGIDLDLQENYIALPRVGGKLSLYRLISD